MPFTISFVYLLLIKHQAYSKVVSFETGPFNSSALYFFSNLWKRKKKSHQWMGGNQIHSVASVGG